VTDNTSIALSDGDTVPDSLVATTPPDDARASRPSSPAAADRQRLLAGPITPQLMRLALPILVVLAVQTLVGVAETYFVSFLGTSALAGVTLVFPLLMLMTMMSNGGMGGGVASAIARAIGAGRTQDADALVLRTLVVALAFGLGFTALVVGGGRILYGMLGGAQDVLHNALVYSNLLFGAAVPIWVVNLLAAALRGAGNVKVPAMLTAVGAVMTLALSPLLIFGWGPAPRLGVAGAGWAVIAYYLVATAAFLAYLRSAKSPIRLVRTRLEWRLFKDILGVGLLSAIGTVTANATVMIAVGLVGFFGADAIAGYGVASRLDYLLIPLLFAIGTASVTLVGINIGARQFERARRTAWIAVAISASACAVIGLVAAVVPQLWIGIFSDEPNVTLVGTDYLRRVAPFYVFYGIGMALYFASQGAGRVGWALLAGLIRLGVVLAGGGYWVAALGGGLSGLFIIAAMGYVAFGLINLGAFASGLAWPRRLAPASEKADQPAFRN
jgi:putative MATE family efflux protein